MYIYIFSFSSSTIELLLMLRDELKSDWNYLTGSIPSEVIELPSFTGKKKGKFMRY
jgi:hypothetical protein